MVTATFWNIIGWGMFIFGMLTIIIIGEVKEEKRQKLDGFSIFLFAVVFPILGLAMALGIK